MAVPKKKTSKCRTRTRNSANSKAAQVTLVVCSHCKEQILPHTVCKKCGYYNGKEVVKQKEETKK